MWLALWPAPRPCPLLEADAASFIVMRPWLDVDITFVVDVALSGHEKKTKDDTLFKKTQLEILKHTSVASLNEASIIGRAVFSLYE